MARLHCAAGSAPNRHRGDAAGNRCNSGEHRHDDGKWLEGGLVKRHSLVLVSFACKSGDVRPFWLQVDDVLCPPFMWSHYMLNIGCIVNDHASGAGCVQHSQTHALSMRWGHYHRCERKTLKQLDDMRCCANASRDSRAAKQT